jgi:hypothetical protein
MHARLDDSTYPWVESLEWNLVAVVNASIFGGVRLGNQLQMLTKFSLVRPTPASKCFIH